MITLEIRDMVKVHGSDGVVDEAIDDVCSYRPSSYRFIKRKYPDYDGVHLYRRSIFPIGLLGRVRSRLDMFEIAYEIVDRRPDPEDFTPVEREELVLRPYQEDAVTDYMGSGGIGVMNACTGSGKTVMAIDIIRRLSVPAVIYVPTKVLLYQWRDEVERFFDLRCGIIGDGECIIRPVTVAMYQTVAGVLRDNPFTRGVVDAWSMESDSTDLTDRVESILSFMKGVGLLVADECHQVGARTFLKAVLSTPSRYKLGLSATSMLRPDGANLAIVAGCGDVSADISTSDLIRTGWLSPLVVKIVSLSDLEHARRSGRSRREYHRIRREYVHGDMRNEAVVDETVELLDENRTVLVLVTEIDHGERLRELLSRRLGRHVNFLCGRTASDERMRVVDDLRDGRDDLVISTSIFEYGLDIPRLSGLVVASPAKSMIKTIQRVGRIMRGFEGKENSKLVDFDDSNADYFRKHFMERLTYYTSEDEFVFEYDGDRPDILDRIGG